MGDTNMCTDNPVLLQNTRNLPTIMCVQRKAAKKVPTEQDIIAANKLAFNDDIGVITNHVTSMFDVQAMYEPGTPEYETLEYRIMCGQLYQQNAIDRAKGVIAKSMPATWYDPKANRTQDGDTMEVIQQKEFYNRIVADKKPYFMIYVYPKLRKKYRDFTNSATGKMRKLFRRSGVRTLEDILNCESLSPDMVEFVEYYTRMLPVGKNNCVVNRIAAVFENIFGNRYIVSNPPQIPFDCHLIKSNITYSKSTYNEIKKVYKEFVNELRDIKTQGYDKIDYFDMKMEKEQRIRKFQIACETICPNKYELCDILIDMLYTSNVSKQFVWDMSGDVIVENLLRRNHNVVHYPELVHEMGEFSYAGMNFVMKEKYIKENDNDYTE